MENTCGEILGKLKNRKNYIFGTGGLGKETYNLLIGNSIEIQAFIDNNPKSASLCDLPVITLDKVTDKNANIIIASINYMYLLEKQAKSEGFDTLSYGILTKVFPELQTFNQAYTGLCEDYLNNKAEYDALYRMLDDEDSKSVLDTLILYRKTLDSSVYANIYNPKSVQYFEDFTQYTETFVDGGAYDGQNTADYIARFPDYKKVYLFEPDSESIKLAKENLSEYTKIEYLEYGISDKSKTLRFDSRHDFGSIISETGNSEIKCIRLDDIVKEERAYIKLDIEGAELDAINGAERLISNGSPLAVCVYHKPEDIRVIPARIKELYPGYKFKLRHYSSCIFETVLYALPVHGD